MTDVGLVLYYREHCHLCEEMVALIHRGWPERLYQLDWRDVDSRDDWREEFGLRVPVLVHGEQLISELVPDRQALLRHFGRPANPV